MLTQEYCDRLETAIQSVLSEHSAGVIVEAAAAGGGRDVNVRYRLTNGIAIHTAQHSVRSTSVIICDEDLVSEGTFIAGFLTGTSGHLY